MDTQDLSKVTVSNLIHVIDLKHFPCVRLVVVHLAPTGKKKISYYQQQTKHNSKQNTYLILFEETSMNL